MGTSSSFKGKKGNVLLPNDFLLEDSNNDDKDNKKDLDKPNWTSAKTSMSKYISSGGNIVHDVEKLELTNNQGEKFNVVNFTVVTNDESGDKTFHNCSAYGDKGKLPEGFQKGYFVKLFGQVR